MRLYLVRHGDKEPGDYWNDGLGGHNDQPLSASGRAEAEAASAWLAARGVGAISASRYSRTSETARPLARALGLGIAVDPLLDEIDVGLSDRLPEAELEARYPGFLAERRAFATDFRYPEGESGSDVAQRVLSFLGAARAGGRDLAAFTHEGWSRVAACVVLGLAPSERRRFRCDTCGIAELEWDEGSSRWLLVRFNMKLEPATATGPVPGAM